MDSADNRYFKHREWITSFLWSSRALTKFKNCYFSGRAFPTTCEMKRTQESGQIQWKYETYAVCERMGAATLAAPSPSEEEHAPSSISIPVITHFK